MNLNRKVAALGPVLVITSLVTSIISSLGAPLIPTIAKDFHDSLGTAQWSLTVTLLSGAVSSPVMGRLGDGPRRKMTIIGGLAAVVAGSAMAALAPEIVVLVIGRALQGVGLGLVPLAMATARDELPKDRVAPMIGLLSVSAAAGVGVGYPISGLIADGWGLSAAYWFGAIIAALALLCVAVVVPSSKTRASVRLDSIGAILLAGALVAVLLAVAQGPDWGWGSPKILGPLVGGLVLFAIWAGHQLRSEEPLVNLRLLRHPAVLTGDVCATVLGVAMYMNLSAETQFVQRLRSGGFGFSVSVVVAGLVLIPFSVFMLVSSRALPALVRYLGVRTLLSVGCLVAGASCVFFALFHGALWESLVVMGVMGIGVGTTFSAIPGLILRSVPASETGSAMGFYQVVRNVGYSLGSALAASILTSHLSSLTGRPTLGGYNTVFWVAGAICVIAAVLAWAMSTRAAQDPVPARRLSDEEIRLLEQSEGEGLVSEGGRD
ncbi:MAG: major facilitator superfamily transporter [Acidimicrobiaceae bacterium]|nr:major facilitator superfamily transporter [Acidimicrobiaceae bacterium]